MSVAVPLGAFTAFRRLLPANQYCWNSGAGGGSTYDDLNPRVFINGNNFIASCDRFTGGGVGTGISKVALLLSTGSTPYTAMTDAGFIFDPASISAHIGTAPATGGQGWFVDTGGTWHLWCSCVNSWTSDNLSRGLIAHLTAPNFAAVKAGTFTFSDIAVNDNYPSSFTNAAVDLSNILFFNGYYCFLYIQYPSGTSNGRSLQLAYSTTLNGPWSTAVVTSNGGPNTSGGGSIDSPGIFTQGSRLKATTFGDNGSCYLWDISNIIAQAVASATLVANFQGTCFTAASYEQTYINGWQFCTTGQDSAGNVYGMLFYGNNASGYVDWISCKLDAFPYTITSWKPNALGNLITNLNNSGSFSVTPTVTAGNFVSIPECCISLNVSIYLNETGTFTASDNITVDDGGTIYGQWGSLTPIAKSVNSFLNITLPLTPTYNSFTINYNLGSAAAATIGYICMAATALPE